MNPQYTNVKVEGPSFPTKGQPDILDDVLVEVSDTISHLDKEVKRLKVRRDPFFLVKSTWMSQEVGTSTWLVNGLEPTIRTFLYVGSKPFTNHLLNSWDIQALDVPGVKMDRHGTTCFPVSSLTRRFDVRMSPTRPWM